MKRVHLINPLENPFGGSENRVLELHRLLQDRAKVSVWSQEGIHPDLKRLLNARLIDPKRFSLPLLGEFFFVGTYYHFGNWLRLTRPQRIGLLQNTPNVGQLHRAMGRLSRMGLAHKVRVAYASEWLRDAAGLPGDILPSPINLSRFSPKKDVTNREKTLTIGRLSRDVQDKHHPEDPLLYRCWAEKGYRIRIMGGTCLTNEKLNHPNIELLACGAETPEDFLRTLDIFFYRTSPSWREPSGRVVSEAMATGLTVICDADGGYAESIADGKDGLLFTDTATAFETMEKVAGDTLLRQRVGESARAKAELLYSAGAMGQVVDWLVGS